MRGGKGKSIKNRSAKKYSLKGGGIPDIDVVETGIGIIKDSPEVYKKPYDGDNYNNIPFKYLTEEHKKKLVSDLSQDGGKIILRMAAIKDNTQPKNSAKTLMAGSGGFGGVIILQGDAIELATLPNYISSIRAHGWGTGGYLFGSGGGLLQKINRDTLSCAFKCYGMFIPDGDDETGECNLRIIQKRPITDGNKKSKGGNIVVYEGTDVNGEKTYESVGNISELKKIKNNPTPFSKLIFANGQLVTETNIQEI